MADRFIPARAGNTRPRRRCSWRCTVHPRSCGKYAKPTTASTYANGSSPLVREIHVSVVLGGQGSRFIPARAGNTIHGRLCRAACTVHPRSCGKYELEAITSAARGGSSPLVREIPRRAAQSRSKPRFIPARAGNTLPACNPRPQLTVHPRSCGKYIVAAGKDGIRAGSSPLVREIHIGIPLAEFLRLVHPRSCGKYHGVGEETKVQDGSSPLVREIRLLQLHVARAGRFIPARAGNTSRRCGSSGSGAVHPRSCGKYLIHAITAAPVGGSSPLVREILFLQPFDFIHFFGTLPGHRSVSLILSKLLRSVAGGVGLEADQLHAVEIHRHASVVAQRAELETGFSRTAPHHHGVAVL